MYRIDSFISRVELPKDTKIEEVISVLAASCGNKQISKEKRKKGFWIVFYDGIEIIEGNPNRIAVGEVIVRIRGKYKLTFTYCFEDGPRKTILFYCTKKSPIDYCSLPSMPMSCVPIAITLSMRLVEFFGGTILFDDPDAEEYCPDIKHSLDRDVWNKMLNDVDCQYREKRILAIKPLTKTEIQRDYKKYEEICKRKMG